MYGVIVRVILRVRLSVLCEKNSKVTCNRKSKRNLEGKLNSNIKTNNKSNNKSKCKITIKGNSNINTLSFTTSKCESMNIGVTIMGQVIITSILKVRLIVLVLVIVV